MRQKKSIVLENPTNREAGNLIANGIVASDYITLIGRCKVEYDGRTSTQYGTGDRHITIQGDGVFRVDTNENRKPKNWQNSGAENNVRISNDDNLVITSSQNQTQGGESITEKVKVEISEVYFATRTKLEDKADFKQKGTEKDMQDYLLRDQSPIETEIGKTIIQIQKEYETDFAGDIDLYGITEDEKIPVAIELKRKKATLDSVSQIKRYVENLSEKNETVIGVLVAPAVTSSARKQLEKSDIYFVQFSPFDAKERANF